MTKKTPKSASTSNSTPDAAQPARQGFYKVTLKDGTSLIAEWREQDKKEGKRWWQYVSDDPTIQKTPVPLDNVVSFESASKQEVDKLLARALTLEEQYDVAYNSYQSLSMKKPGYEPAFPESRRLKIGDEIEYGHLPEAKVVALRDEGRIIIFSHRAIDNNYGRPIDHGTRFMACHWTSAILKSAIQPTTLVRKPRIHDTYRISSLDSIVHRAIAGVDASPDYQRGYVWTADDKERFLDSVFASRDLGRFIFVKREYPHVQQILDGKQRLNCLLEFVTSQISYKGVYWHQLSAGDRNRIESHSVQFAELQERAYSREDLLQIFLEVNVAGVPQSEEHLNYVREQLALEQAKNAAKGA